VAHSRPSKGTFDRLVSEQAPEALGDADSGSAGAGAWERESKNDDTGGPRGGQATMECVLRVLRAMVEVIGGLLGAAKPLVPADRECACGRARTGGPLGREAEAG